MITDLSQPLDYDTKSPEYRACITQALGVRTLHASPTNPRKHFDEAALAELAENVRQHGVMQPILVRPWPANQPISADFTGGFPLYEVVAGERRYRAALRAGLDLIPGLVRHLTDREVLELQIIENLQRRDLTEFEEADGYRLMMKDHGYTADELAARINKSKAYIYARLKLCDLDFRARKTIDSAGLPASIALLIARIPVSPLQKQAAEEITQRQMSHRQAQQHIHEQYMLDLRKAPFDRKDASLTDAGSCTDCPKRTGNLADLFSDVASADVCTDPHCYRDKKVANMRATQRKLEEKGKTVVTGDDAKKILPSERTVYASGGYQLVDDKNYSAIEDGKAVTYGELAKRAGIEPIHVVHPGTQTVVAVVKEADLKKALKQAGDTTPASPNDAARAEEKKRKEAAEFRQRLYAEVRQEIVAHLVAGNPLDSWHLRTIARQTYWGAGFEACHRITQNWIPREEIGDGHERHRVLGERIASMSDADLMLLMIDCCVGGHLHIGGYSSSYAETPPVLAELAVRWGVDADALKKDLKAAAREKAKGTKKGTARKVAGETAEKAPDPEPAARANEPKPAPKRKAKPTAPATQAAAAAKPAASRAWPFPTSAAEAKPAARAGADEPNEQAAGAAKKPRGKTKAAAGQARQEEGNTPATNDAGEGAIERCTRTIDMLSGQAACEQGAAA